MVKVIVQLVFLAILITMFVFAVALIYGDPRTAPVVVKTPRAAACYLNNQLITSFTDIDVIALSPQGGTLYLEIGENRAVYRLRPGEICTTDDGKIHKGEQPLYAEEEEERPR